MGWQMGFLAKIWNISPSSISSLPWFYPKRDSFQWLRNEPYLCPPIPKFHEAGGFLGRTIVAFEKSEFESYFAGSTCEVCFTQSSDISNQICTHIKFFSQIEIVHILQMITNTNPSKHYTNWYLIKKENEVFALIMMSLTSLNQIRKNSRTSS